MKFSVPLKRRIIELDQSAAHATPTLAGMTGPAFSFLSKHGSILTRAWVGKSTAAMAAKIDIPVGAKSVRIPGPRAAGA